MVVGSMEVSLFVNLKFLVTAPLENLAKDTQLQAFKHRGFWKPMDTLKDKQDLNEAWDFGTAEWKIWK